MKRSQVRETAIGWPQIWELGGWNGSSVGVKRSRPINKSRWVSMATISSHHFFEPTSTSPLDG